MNKVSKAFSYTHLDVYKRQAFDRANAKNLPLYSASAAITHGDKNKELLSKCVNKLGWGYEFNRAELIQIFSQKFGFDITQDVDCLLYTSRCV